MDVHEAMNIRKLVPMLKVAAGAVIVAGAAIIVFPSLMRLSFGIGRLALWLIVIVLTANVVARTWSAISKKLLIVAWAVIICAPASVITARAGEPRADSCVVIPAGTTFEGRIDTKIGSAVSHSGQRFGIVMASPVLANGTTILIPAGTKVMGEVVEAIPASHVYRERGDVKPKGKLRIQLTALQMPNGMIFPMVASLAGETFGNGYMHSDNPNLGHGVGYVGSPAGFGAVSPHSEYSRRPGGGLKPNLVGREQMLHDPLYGVSQTQPGMGGGLPVYRSLTQRGNNIEISYESPLSVRLDAALKIPVAAISQSMQEGMPAPAAPVPTSAGVAPVPALTPPDNNPDPGF